MKGFMISLLCLSYSLSCLCQYVKTDELKVRANLIDSIAVKRQSISEGAIKTDNELGQGGFSNYYTDSHGGLMKISAHRTIHYGYNKVSPTDTIRSIKHYYKIDTPNTEYIITDYYYYHDSVFLIRTHAQYYDLTQSFFSDQSEIFITNNFIGHLYIGDKSRKSYYEKLIANASYEYSEWKKQYEEDEQLKKEYNIGH